MKPFFTAEDFEKQKLWDDMIEKQKLWDAIMQTHPTNPYGVILSVIADIANAKLQKKGKRVYRHCGNELWIEAECEIQRDTHTALLICEERIEK